MDALTQYRSLYRLLAASQRVLVVGHKKPDGDAIGASTALYRWLKAQNKDVVLFCLDAPGPAFRFLENFHDFTTDPAVFDASYDAIVVLDSGDLRYCGIDQLVHHLPLGYQIINIDHHPTNQGYGDFNLVLTEASSTSEIIYRFLMGNGQAIDSATATSLMTGILFDTHYFSNAATKPESMDAVSKLTAAGARASEIGRALYLNKDAKILQLWGCALSRLHHNQANDIAVTYLKTEDMVRAGVGPAATEGIANFLSTVCGGAETILILTQADENLIKGSFRSVKRDVTKLAKLLGGGGHKLAAGFAIPGRIVETEYGVKIV
jgi:phosphoesterase RecJ-like protein